MPSLVQHVIFQSFVASGCDRLVWRLRPKQLRILCYHGICADSLAGEPWVPSYFVTQSAFERQLQYLQRHANLLHLSQAVACLRDGSLPPRCVSITFDDGYANNLELAYPLLKKYQAPATVFLASAYMESGEIFPFLKLKLIKLSGRDGCEPSLPPPLDYKANPLDLVVQRAKPHWERLAPHLSDYQRRTLRPLTVEEVQLADPRLIEFGAHSHTHCILTNESRLRRREEILTSIDKVEQFTGRRVLLFSYPNGQREDFDELDKEVLRSRGIEAAVSGMAGANDGRADALELRRFPVGMYHGDAGFRAEVAGFRAALLAVRGRLES